MNMLDLIIAPAYAAGEEPSLLGALAPMVLLFAVFYFLLIRPQQKRTKEHRKLVEEISVGDEITTVGGVCGVVTEVSTSFIQLQADKAVNLQIKRDHVSQVFPKGTLEGNVELDTKKKK